MKHTDKTLNMDATNRKEQDGNVSLRKLVTQTRKVADVDGNGKEKQEQ